MIGIERGGQKVRIAKLKISGCFLRTHCFVLHISMCHLICLRRIREDWKLDPAWILVLVDSVLHYSLLRLAESDLQLVHGSKLGYWGQWSKERFLGGGDQVHSLRGKIFISGYVLFLKGDRFFSDLSPIASAFDS